MQVLWKTTSDRYIADRARIGATLQACPFHLEGGRGLGAIVDILRRPDAELLYEPLDASQGLGVVEEPGQRAQRRQHQRRQLMALQVGALARQ